MTASNYAACYALTRQYEGGNDDDPRDPGGRTSRGVTQARYDQYRADKGLLKSDVWKASEAEIAEIYRIYYWNAVVGDQWPEGPDLAVWDCGVHSGSGRSKSISEALLGKALTFSTLAASCRAQTDKTRFVKAFCAKRLAFLQNLAIWKTYKNGFSKRVASVEANGVKMALAAAGTPAAEQKKRLEQEAAGAQTKAKKSAAGAGTSGTGTVATGSGASQQGSLEWLTIFEWAAALVALGLITWFFIHWYRAHKDRADAYAAVAAATGG